MHLFITSAACQLGWRDGGGGGGLSASKDESLRHGLSFAVGTCTIF